MHLEGKTVCITGVSKGIGKALVHLFLERGAKVAGLGRNKPEIEHSNFLFISTDVRKEMEVTAALGKVQAQFGNEIHILINNAGLGYFGYIEELALDHMHEMFETNVYPIFYTSRTVVPQMKAQGFGHIINIASTAGIEGYPQVSAYCGTKFAVKGISESMYKELREYKIKVTCIYPGSTKTDFFRNVANIDPHDYMLMPEDVALMIVQATETPDNFHQVNIEVRPLQPRGPKKP